MSDSNPNKSRLKELNEELQKAYKLEEEYWQQRRR